MKLVHSVNATSLFRDWNREIKPYMQCTNVKRDRYALQSPKSLKQFYNWKEDPWCLAARSVNCCSLLSCHLLQELFTTLQNFRRKWSADLQNPKFPLSRVTSSPIRIILGKWRHKEPSSSLTRKGSRLVTNCTIIFYYQFLNGSKWLMCLREERLQVQVKPLTHNKRKSK